MALYYADVHRGGERLRQRAGKARRYLPKGLRREMYVEALTLASRGLGYRKIVRELQEKYGLAVAKSTISCWVRGIYTPYYRRFPDEERVKIYREALRLHAEGYGCRKIAKRLKIGLSTVKDWVAGRCSPYGPEPPAGLPAPRPTKHRPRITELVPSPELAYVIGAVLGDGTATHDGNYGKVIALKAKDEEFVREFARCLTKVLGRENPVKVRFWKTCGLFVARARSAALYRLLRKPADIDKLRSYIEHCDDCVAAFLRGFFDSEGTISGHGEISIVNTDLGMIRYVRRLLGRLGIEVRGPRLQKPKGTPMYFPGRREAYKKRDCFVMRIRKHCNPTYYQRVGFTITRKRRRLEKYLEKRLDHVPLPQLSP